MDQAGPILIVDDNDATRDVLRTMLTLRGYAVAEAENGQAALRYFADGGRACLLILDMMMPDMSGDQVRSALKADPRTAAIPVIVYSAVDDTGRIADVVAYVRKAMDPDELLRVIDQACGRHPRS